MKLSGWAGNRVPCDFLHLKSSNLWSDWHLENRVTAGDITRPGREVQEQGAPDGGSLLVGSFSTTTRRGGNSGPSVQPVSCLIQSHQPLGLAGFLNHRDAWRPEEGGDGARWGGSRSPAESGLDVTPWSLGTCSLM